MKIAAENIGLARFTSDDPYEYAKMARYGISLNLDGIWGGNMYPAGAGAILPNRITSKHNIRYVPEQDGLEIVQRIREFLDANGYEDVEMTIVGDVPWSEMNFDSDVARAFLRMYDIFGITHRDRPDEATILGGYWPAYLFVNDEVSPIQSPSPVAGRDMVEVRTRPTSSGSSRAPGKSTEWRAPRSRWRQHSMPMRD